MDSPHAGPSNLRSISGTTPGVLDFSQPSRLLRHPNAILSFASFDPTIAHATSKSGKTNGDQYYSPKRIVIETTSEGTSFWRFVPRARMEEGVQDEGVWPRMVDVCGERMHCTQDQWDIYKLDPAYDCLVQAAPKLFVISKAELKPPSPAPSLAEELPRKRRPLSPQSDVPAPSAHKKPRGRSTSITASSDDGNMSIDEGPDVRSRSQHRSGLRDIHEKKRKERREKTFRAQAKWHQQEDETMFSPADEEPTTLKARFSSLPPRSATKRKVAPPKNSAHTAQPVIDEEDEESDSRQPDCRSFKRTRTASPTNTKKTLESKRVARERGKQERWGKIMESRKKDRNRRFMNDILEEVPASVRAHGNNGFHESAEPSDAPQNYPPLSTTPPDDNNGPQAVSPEPEQMSHEEQARCAALEESIRKLQELEKDKPLWDEAAKKRKMRETAEEDELRAKAERRRQAAAAQAERERQAKVETEGKEARARAEAEKREREAGAKRAREKMQEQQRWETGPWTTSRALDRYRTLCESFDSTKFSPNDPLTFEDVPWPVLHAPRTFSVEDVDWAAVERFFEMVKPFVRGAEYSAFVEKSHRRFHPDRWRSRRLLASILDEGERECLEVAANTVAQALTPIWRDLK